MLKQPVKSRKTQSFNLSTGFIFINCTLNETHISKWVFKANNTLCIHPTTIPTTVPTAGKTSMSLKPTTNITNFNQTVTPSSDVPWFISKWTPDWSISLSWLSGLGENVFCCILFLKLFSVFLQQPTGRWWLVYSLYSYFSYWLQCLSVWWLNRKRETMDEELQVKIIWSTFDLKHQIWFIWL